MRHKLVLLEGSHQYPSWKSLRASQLFTHRFSGSRLKFFSAVLWLATSGILILPASYGAICTHFQVLRPSSWIKHEFPFLVQYFEGCLSSLHLSLPAFLECNGLSAGTSLAILLDSFSPRNIISVTYKMYFQFFSFRPTLCFFGFGLGFFLSCAKPPSLLFSFWLKLYLCKPLHTFTQLKP